MSWSPTARRNAVSGVVCLLSRSAWRDSPYGPQLRQIVESALDDEDRVLRYHAARGLALLELEPRPALALVRQRLFTETQAEIAAVLVRRLHELTPHLPQEVDALVAELVDDPLWRARLASDDHDTVDSLAPLISLVVRLAVVEGSAAATRSAEAMFSDPVAWPISRRGITVMRHWLSLPADRAVERRRAFSIVGSAARALDALRASAEPAAIADVYRTADAIAAQLFYSSGANGPDANRPPTPAADGFAAEAFPLIETLTGFKEPRTVHHLVQTLAHLAPAAPSRAFRIVEQAVGAGEPYTYDSLAADATIGLIERYLAEFRQVLITDPELLSAVRRVLSAFVRAGWPAALMLSSRLSDAFR